MAKYIELEDAYKTLSDYYHHSTYVQSIALREALDRVPAADVVEVVRCKDCINHMQSGLCEGWSRYGTINTPDDAFCSYGVKRNG